MHWDTNSPLFGPSLSKMQFGLGFIAVSALNTVTSSSVWAVRQSESFATKLYMAEDAMERAIPRCVGVDVTVGTIPWQIARVCLLVGWLLNVTATC